MRVSLWPGLLRAALENQRRQQDRIRLFEHGARFVVTPEATLEVDTGLTSNIGATCSSRPKSAAARVKQTIEKAAR